MCHGDPVASKPAAAPSLAGVVGRPAASTDYPYSLALKKAGLTWDKASLDRFLTAPAKLVPGTRMPVAVPRADERAALIAYLRTLKR